MNGGDLSIEDTVCSPNTMDLIYLWIRHTSLCRTHRDIQLVPLIERFNCTSGPQSGLSHLIFPNPIPEIEWAGGICQFHCMWISLDKGLKSGHVCICNVVTQWSMSFFRCVHYCVRHHVSVYRALVQHVHDMLYVLVMFSCLFGSCLANLDGAR